MTYSQLKKLLDIFYEGESTPEQEKELREYFASESNIPEEFRADAELFRAMDAPCQIPAGLEARIIDATIGRRRIHHWPWLSAAAAAVIMLVLSTPPESGNYREVTDLAEAEAITVQVAQTLNKSVSKLEILNNLPL